MPPRPASDGKVVNGKHTARVGAYASVLQGGDIRRGDIARIEPV